MQLNDASIPGRSEWKGLQASYGPIIHSWNTQWIRWDSFGEDTDLTRVSSNTLLIGADAKGVSANIGWIGADLLDVFRNGRKSRCQLSGATWEIADSLWVGADGYSQRLQISWVDSCSDSAWDDAETEGVGADGRWVSADN